MFSSLNPSLEKAPSELKVYSPNKLICSQPSGEIFAIRVAAPIRVKNSQPLQKAYILEHSFFTSHNLDFIVLERIKMMYGIMR